MPEDEAKSWAVPEWVYLGTADPAPRTGALRSRLPPELDACAAAFVSSLTGMSAAISLPFHLALAAKLRSWTVTKLIRNLTGRLRPERQKGGRLEVSRQVLRQALDAALVDKDRDLDTTMDLLVTDLESVGRSPDVTEAGWELVRVGVVLLWSAHEVLVTDTVEAVLNRWPDLAIKLLGEPTTKRFLGTGAIQLEEACAHEFDLRSAMGTLVLARARIGSLERLKAVCRVVAPGSTVLDEALSSRDLWLLQHRRHIIVHRRAIVDQAYLDQTGDPDVSLGERLRIRERDLIAYSQAVDEVAACLLKACSAHWSLHPHDANS